MATALEIREKSGKMKKVEMVREKSGNLRKRKVREKSWNSERLSDHKSFTTPQVQLDSSFCQNAVSRSQGKCSDVREKSGKSGK